MESVVIQHENKGHHMLNSKSEYNRCSLPRLTAKMGEYEVKKFKKELEEEKRRDEELANQIKQLRKDRNKSRITEPPEKEQPAGKKRKLEDNKWLKVINRECTRAEKRQSEEVIGTQEGKTKRGVEDIRRYMSGGLEARQPEGSDSTLEATLPVSMPAGNDVDEEVCQPARREVVV